MTEQGWCPWHVLTVVEDGEDKTYELFHPEACHITISTSPAGPFVEYECQVSHAVNNFGVRGGVFDGHPAAEEDGLPPIGSWWLMRYRFYKIRESGPWGFEEWDEEAEVRRLIVGRDDD